MLRPSRSCIAYCFFSRDHADHLNSSSKTYRKLLLFKSRCRFKPTHSTLVNVRNVVPPVYNELLNPNAHNNDNLQFSFFNTAMTFGRSNPISVNETTLASARPAISASVAVLPVVVLILAAGA